MTDDRTDVPRCDTAKGPGPVSADWRGRVRIKEPIGSGVLRTLDLHESTLSATWFFPRRFAR